MSSAIKKLTVQGFKSIRSLENFEPGNLAVLIGPNGAGKSNLVSFFDLLNAMVEQRLEGAINTGGGADIHLHLGPKQTPEVFGKIEFGLNGYEFTLTRTNDNRLIFGEEWALFGGYHYEKERRTLLGRGHSESKLMDRRESKTVSGTKGDCSYVYDAVSSWVVYHFHDTSSTASVRGQGKVRDNERLRADAGNLGAFLLSVREHAVECYERIRDTIRLVAPFFDDFKLRPIPARKADPAIQLEWTQRGSDYPFHPSQMSDGTLRFVCLATTLLQPNPPTTIILDEPELGLHPTAIQILSELIHNAASRTQVIVSTQSPGLLNYFDPADVVVVDRTGSESTFTRLKPRKLKAWLENYSLAELWEKNVISGKPR